MVDITKLADKWRRRYDETGQVIQGRCATELEAALPTWTRITEDEATWPELDGEDRVEIIARFPDHNGRPGRIEAFEWDENDMVALMEGYKLKFNWYRYTCDLDYPPEEL